ncbi:hypothetical protein EVAR_19452_1 [Eumeta japonica]|uniref:Uncharacterized protein n=1 Tax=Eumeta variegata TaxID=151549 RepID=A0A4C1V9Z6_EUMVA|nr:hypothetical protein EVAR_19452_1 [Eumeta japonica]
MKTEFGNGNVRNRHREQDGVGIEEQIAIRIMISYRNRSMCKTKFILSTLAEPWTEIGVGRRVQAAGRAAHNQRARRPPYLITALHVLYITRFALFQVSWAARLNCNTAKSLIASSSQSEEYCSPVRGLSVLELASPRPSRPPLSAPCRQRFYERSCLSAVSFHVKASHKIYSLF